MPNSVITPVALSEHFSPLWTRKTGIMIRFTFSVMCLGNPDQAFCFAIESLPMALLLTGQFRQLCLRETDLIHRSLPSTLTPSPKILIDALAFQPIEPSHRNHFPSTPPIRVVIQRNQRITADHCSCNKPIEKPSKRSQEVRVITKRLRLTVLLGNQRIEQK